MADVGGLLYDKDAMYIDIPDWKVRRGFGSGRKPCTLHSIPCTLYDKSAM